MGKINVIEIDSNVPGTVSAQFIKVNVQKAYAVLAGNGG